MTTATCTAPFHGSWKAFSRGCTCKSESYTKWRAYKDRDNAKRSEQQRNDVKAASPHARFPQVREAGPYERALRDRDDRACAGSPLSVWFPVGVPTRQQLDEAWAYCTGCPVVQLCLRAGIEAGDDESLRAFTSPKQRRDLRARERGVHAA